MSSERFEAGLAVRREVLGTDYVDRVLASTDSFSRDLQVLATEFCWGSTWARGVLERKTRSILNLGMLAALGRPEEFKLHVKGALTNGCTLDEIKEVLLQITAYCGVPAGMSALRVTREAFAELGIEPDKG